MPVYKYLAKDKNGKQVKGELTSDSKRAAISALKSVKVYPFAVTEITAKTGAAYDKRDIFKKSITRSQVAIFARQFATMLQAGVPLPAILDVLIRQEKNKDFKKVLESINTDILKGNMLSSAMSKFKEFPQLMISMVAVGEANGRLDMSFERVASNMEKEMKLRTKIKSAMIYPVVLLIVTILASTVLIFTVLPMFSKMFVEMGATLPPTTLAFFGFSGFIRSYWYVVAVVVLFVIIIIHKLLHESLYREKIDKLVLGLPLFGKLQNIIIMATFCRTFSTLLEAGIGVVSALETVRNVINNKYVKRGLDDVIKEVESGSTISRSISDLSVFTPLVVSMTRIGEESGRLGETLSKTADIYEEDSEAQLQRLSSLVEPTITVIMALGIGFIIISIVQPMFKFYTLVGR